MRKAVIEPETAKRRGCIFKLIGDGLLAEFGSVVDAVECAVSLQRALDERNADVPQNERLELRIGLNLVKLSSTVTIAMAKASTRRCDCSRSPIPAASASPATS